MPTMINPHTFENARPDGFPVLEIIPRPECPDSATSNLRQFVPLQHTELIGEISGPMAGLQLVQRFRFSKTQHPSPIEAAYRFPLPGDAAITGVHVQFGEVTVEAELAERTRAEQTYRTARDEGRQATLLTRESPDVFTLHLAGLKPDEDVMIRTSYVQLAHAEGSGWSIRVPLTTVPRYVRGDERGSAHANGQPIAVLRDPGHRFSLDLTLEAAETVVSPTHPLDVAASEDRLRVRLRDGEVIPDRDCVLNWQPQRQAGRPTLTALRHVESDGNASCLLALVAPPAADAATATIPREILLLIDHSGSMEGPKWEAADWAVQNLLAGLTAVDTVNLGLFHSTTRWFARSPVRADERTLRQARDFLLTHKDSGGTELGVALEQALAQARDDDGRARHIVVVTDAQVSDAGRILALVEREAERPDRRRIDVLCIDAAPNDGLVNQLAERGGGLARFLTSNPAENDIASALDEVLADWAAPILRNLTLETASPDVQAAGRRVTFDTVRQVSRVDLGDLPSGRAVWAAIRVTHPRGSAPGLRLLADGQEITQEEPAKTTTDARRPAVAALFGARRVLDLELVQTSGIASQERLRQLGHDPNALPGDATAAPIYAENARVNLSEALHDLLVHESLRYGIVSSATAFVAMRSETGERITGTIIVPNALAHGWSDSFAMGRVALGGAAPMFAMQVMPMPGPLMAYPMAAPPDPPGRPSPQQAAPGDTDATFEPHTRFSRALSRGPAADQILSIGDAAQSLLKKVRRRHAGGRAEEAAGVGRGGRLTVFEGVPAFGSGVAVLFDSTAGGAPQPPAARLTRLTVTVSGGGPLDEGVTLDLFVDDLTTPRARIRLSDLLKQGGQRPLNLARQPGGVVRIELRDPRGVWSATAPALAVGLA